MPTDESEAAAQAPKGASKIPPPPAAPPEAIEAAPPSRPAEPGEQAVAGLQPAPAPAVLVEAPAPDVDDGLDWDEQRGARGVVITVTKDGGAAGTTTREFVLPHGATDAEIAAAKVRLRKQFIDG